MMLGAQSSSGRLSASSPVGQATVKQFNRVWKEGTKRTKIGAAIEAVQFRCPHGLAASYTSSCTPSGYGDVSCPEPPVQIRAAGGAAGNPAYIEAKAGTEICRIEPCSTEAALVRGIGRIAP